MTPDDDRPLTPRSQQSRDGWRRELGTVIARARQEGDTRPAMEIFNEWLKFRRQVEDGT